jgi:hypothetical protein
MTTAPVPQHRSRAASVLTALVAVVGSAIGPALAQTAVDGDGNGEFGGDGTSAEIAIWASSSAEPLPVDADDPNGPSRWTRRVTPDPWNPDSPLAGTCPTGTDPITGDPIFGWPFTIDLIDNHTGEVVSTRRICVPLDPDAPGVPPAPPLEPRPPTYGEVWRAAAIVAPRIGVNPWVEGVTGLTTRLWAVSSDTVTIDVRIRGYTATGTATRVGFWFSPGDTNEVVRVTGGGSKLAPAAIHVYERTGDYVLRAGALWSATVTIAGPDLPPTTIDLGQALLVVSRDYHVVEVRSRLTE